ncbi:hypothetical protein ABZV93_25810 [Actinopolymorpha sp. NPDC004070]|uniref:hypothetical protein n=1 Tax=Actinopolymorpha sp. NPDC004070 TaxID=3154548 RepID=UPI0033BF3316
MSKKNAGLSLWYRFRWRTVWLLLHVMGPADLPDHIDPRSRMVRERAARQARALAKAQEKAQEATRTEAETTAGSTVA